ncbi:TlpA disulfide reductase family protein [Sphingobacterium sp.]|uniref:TlpA family protein disulfide reductase n=1 Tax=Sphingobacterium sp. TaxID=341027 RepID=UPI0031DFA5C7
MMKKLKLQSNSSALLYIQILKITVLVTLYLLVSMFSLSAQTPRKDSGADGLPIKYLKIGDTIPQALWDLKLDVVGHPARVKQTTLRDYSSKKLIILDFWATWCSSCIAAFPGLYKLQNDLGDQIKVLSVTYQDRAAIEKFINKSEFIRSQGLKNTFSSVVGDKLLTKYFEKSGIPFTVCIDNRGVVRSLSEPSELNAPALRQMIRDTNAVPVAAQVIEFKRPLLGPYYDNKIHNYYYSTLLPYGRGISQASVFNVDSLQGYKQLVVPNLNVFMQYAVALQYSSNYSAGIARIPSRCILEVSDPDRIVNKLSTIQHFWEYTYESVSPITYEDKAIYRKMERDLNFYLGMTASYQKRNVNCLVIRVADPRKLIINKESTQSPKVILNGLMESDGTANGKFLQKAENDYKQVKNAIIGIAVKHIPNLFNRRKIAALPFMIDETGLSDQVSITLPDNINDLEQLKQAFAARGMTLSLENRNLVMLVLREDGYRGDSTVLQLTEQGYVAVQGKEGAR